MKIIEASTVAELVRKGIPHLAYELPVDVSAGQCAMCEHERIPIGKSVLSQLCTNDKIAREDQVPLCQDTGTVRVSIQVGKDVAISGDIFDGVNDAVAEAYDKGKLRLSVVKDSLNDRANTGNNTPAFCEVEIVDEPGVARLNLMIKGGGSDNASRVHMLVPGDGHQGIIDHIVACVKEKAASACPPLTLGIGVGGTFDKVAQLAQRALFRPVGVHSSNPDTAKFEEEILEAVNATGVGPGGLGGVATVQQVNVETDASHIASMPLAIDMGCSAMRRVTVDIPCRELTEDGGCSGELTAEIIEDALNKGLAAEPGTAERAAASVKEVMDKAAAKREADGKSMNAGEGQDEAIRLQLPLSRDDLKNLKAGDKVLLSGPIYTLRDAGHIRLLDEMEEGKPLPYGLDGQTIYYAGPSPAAAGRPFGAIGPTTATRMDFAAPTLYENGIVATIGKGHRNEAVHESCKKTGSVFFCTIGGCAAYLAKCIKSAELIAYEDLGTEALRKCEVEDFPVFVGIDTNGNDVYDHD